MAELGHTANEQLQLSGMTACANTATHCDKITVVLRIRMVCNVLCKRNRYFSRMEPRIQNVSGFLRKGTLELLHKPRFYKIISNELSQTQITDSE